MTASARTLKTDWQAIQQAAIAGVSYPVLAKRFRVSLDAVKQRACRGKWPVPARILRRAKELAVSPDVTAHDAVTAGAESLLKDGQTATLHGMRILLAKLEKAAAKPSSVADIEDVQDVVAAAKGARVLAGMDREGASVTVSFQWGPPGSEPEERPRVLDVGE